ncbi:MAG TPA: porin [Rhodoferax sp.]
MKKSLIALAVLAASGAAMAQSSVTLYGWADTFLAFSSVENVGNVASTKLNTTSLADGAVNGNRWGIKGTEDLGGGLSAQFQLEQGFTLSDGKSADATKQFSRQAWVGLAGGFGSVHFGRNYSAYDDINGGVGDPVFDSALSPQGAVFKSDSYTTRFDNSIRYDTPNFSGFTAAVNYGMNEDKSTTADATANTSFNVKYASGPLVVALAYENDQVSTANKLLGLTDKKFTRLAASYDLGTVVVKGNYGKAGNIAGVNGADATEYIIGADYKMTSALTLSAGYAHSSDNAAAGDATRKGFGLGAAYSLSKRTFVYGGYEGDNQTLAGTPDYKHSVVALGINHKF